MLNTRSYYDEIAFTARRFSEENPAAHVTISQVFQGGQTTNVTVTVRGEQSLRDAARAAFQPLGDYCHAEEYDAPNNEIDFSWAVA